MVEALQHEVSALREQLAEAMAREESLAQHRDALTHAATVAQERAQVGTLRIRVWQGRRAGLWLSPGSGMHTSPKAVAHLGADPCRASPCQDLAMEVVALEESLLQHKSATLKQGVEEGAAAGTAARLQVRTGAAARWGMNKGRVCSLAGAPPPPRQVPHGVQWGGGTAMIPASLEQSRRRST